MHNIDSGRIHIVFPTEEERRCLLQFSPKTLSDLTHHVSGIGSWSTAHCITDLVHRYNPSLIVHVGLAGSFDVKLPLGAAVQVVKVAQTDHGAEGDVDLLNLVPSQHRDTFPRKDGYMHAPELDLDLGIPPVSELTVPYTTACPQTRMKRAKFGMDIETMEGAALFYSALRLACAFVSIRGISNHVGDRDKSHWRIDEAMCAISDVLSHTILSM